VHRLRPWVWAAAAYNLVISLPLLLPEAFEANYRLINRINDGLNLGGERAVAPDEAVNRLFVNFASLLLVFLALLLLYASRDLEHRLGIVFLNAAARIASVLLFAYYLLFADAPRLLLGFVICDLVFAVAFLVHIRRNRGLSPGTWLA
jgi:hypothetical protein